MRCRLGVRLGVRLGGDLIRGDTRGRPDVLGVPAGGGRRQVQGRVLLEHRQLKFPQLRARLDGQFLDQQRAPGAVGLERVGLATAAVESDHQLPAEPLAQRMLRNELLELGAYAAVPAKREFGVDDLVLCLFWGHSRAAVIRVSDRLGIPRERLMDSLWIGQDTSKGPQS